MECPATNQRVAGTSFTTTRIFSRGADSVLDMASVTAAAMSLTIVSLRPSRMVICASGIGSDLYADVGDLGIERDRVSPAFASEPRLLGAAEGGPQVPEEPAVDPADAHLHRSRHAM